MDCELKNIYKSLITWQIYKKMEFLKLDLLTFYKNNYVYVKYVIRITVSIILFTTVYFRAIG